MCRTIRKPMCCARMWCCTWRREIIAEPTPYLRTRRAALATLASLRTAADAGEFLLSAQDASWLDILSEQADELPEDESQLIDTMAAQVERDKVHLEEYEIGDRARG